MNRQPRVGSRWFARPDLIASAKRHGLDPFVHLRDVLARISDHPSNKLHELLPDHWKLAALAA